MLALVVGIGIFIYTQGYGDNISAVFNNAGSLLEQVNKSQEEAKEEAEKAAARSGSKMPMEIWLIIARLDLIPC